MKTVIKHPERPKRNITWQTQPLPAHCDHEFEKIVHLLGEALKRCLKCGRSEAA
jgi:hypothetical protein